MSGGRTLFQVSLLQALSQGDYEGHLSISDLKKHGDIGLGTFDGLDGELIMLDGIVYRASADGSVSVVEEDTTPFACVSFMDDSQTLKIKVSSFRDFSDRMDAIFSENGINSPYFVRIHSKFPSMLLRSVPRQSGSTPLIKVVEEQQVTWSVKDIEGTVIGLFCPAFMSTLNSHGWHLHFISDDRKVGGHVLDLSINESTVFISRIDSISVVLPGTVGFQSKDLGSDRANEIRRIEGIR